MQIRIQCPKCGKIEYYEEHAADKRIRCPACYLLFSVPSLDTFPKAKYIIEHSKSHLYVDEEGNTFA